MKAKIGRNSFAWEEMRTNSIQKSEKPERKCSTYKTLSAKICLAY
jgi:hypothetical protein